MGSTLLKMIRKRNGDIVPFDQTKIVSAISRAFLEIERTPRPAEAEVIAAQVVAELEKRANENHDYTPSVEETQDLVEKGLMDGEHFTVAKSYIIYRFEHARDRETKFRPVIGRCKRRAAIGPHTGRIDGRPFQRA